MTTPYGTTNFERYVPGNNGVPARGLRITLADKTRTVLENWLNEPKMSYFWDREATELYPSDPANHNYTHCAQIRWTFDNANSLEAPSIQWKKEALENSTVNYFYPNQIVKTIEARLINQFKLHARLVRKMT